MGRPKKTLRPIPLNLSLDEDIAVQMKLELWSDVEEKIPHGAQSKFINQILRKHFKSQKARLAQLKRLTPEGQEASALKQKMADEALADMMPEAVEETQEQPQ